MNATHFPFERESALDVIVRMSPTQFFLPAHAVANDAALNPGASRRTASIVDVVIGGLHRLAERFDRWAWDQQMREREAYLAQSVDIFDLEQRIRGIERGYGR